MDKWTNGQIEIIATEGKIDDEVLEGLKKETIFWSDSLKKHYFFTFETVNYWIESIKINNELNKFEITIIEKI